MAAYTYKVLRTNWDHVKRIAEDLFLQKTLDEEYFLDLRNSLSVERIDPVDILGDS